MRILIDTNILFSALLFPESNPAKAVDHVIENHKVVLCKQNVEELREIVERKAPEHRISVDKFLQKLAYEEISAKENMGEKIRDVTDQPILNAAIKKQVDIILTGDKDFLSMDMEYLKCMTVAQFLKLEKI